MKTIKIHNVQTGEIIEREMNAQEIAQNKIDEESYKNWAAELAAKDAAKKAVLDKLGLTADEVDALLG